MIIIEQTTVGKKNQQECEDGIVVNNGFVAVIDGSTSKTPTRIAAGMTNGRYCMELVSEYVNSMPADIDVQGFCAGVTSLLCSEYGLRGIDVERLERNPVERLTASAVIFSAYRRQVWMVGDCQCIVGGTLYDNPKPQEAPLAEERARYLERAIAGGMAVSAIQADDPGRKHILNNLMESCKKQNIDYPVIDGFDIPIDKERIIDACDCGQDIILASDGYPFLKPTLAESENALAAQLDSDPLCIRSFKATKGLASGNNSFDDRCYVRFKG